MMEGYPEILRFGDGTPVAAENDWQKRREELKNFFADNVYGRFLCEEAVSVSYEVAEERETDGVITRKIVASFVSSAPGYRSKGNEPIRVPFLVYLPKNAVRPPVVVYNILQNYADRMPDYDVENEENVPSFSTLPLKTILSNGIAVATYRVSDVNEDAKGSEDGGLCALYNGGKKSLNSAAVIRTWAKFSSVVADFLIADGKIDEKRMGVAGHSRGGKTALTAAVFDERFAFVYVSNSGCTGVSLAKFNDGERIRDINTHFPHWFCEKYKEYDGQDDALPFDFHQYCALVAPRELYVSSSSEDAWACPRNEFLSCRLASEVYEKIYGVKGLVAPETPEPDTPYQSGRIAYHVKTGKHSFDFSDWLHLIAFIRKKR